MADKERWVTLLEELESLAACGGGTYGVAAKNLSTGETLELRAGEEFNTASVIKVPLLVEVFRRAAMGTLDLDERLELRAEDTVGGAGLLKDFAPGLRPTIHDLCVAMIVISDNMATNLLATRVGIQAVNEGMQSLGLTRTTLNRLVTFQVPPKGQPEELGLSTPAEMLQLFELLAMGRVVSVEASREMVRILSLQRDRLMIRRYLPDHYDSVSGKSDPEVANKTGAISGVRNDVALLTFSDGRRWVLSIFSKHLQDRSWQVDHQGELTIARIARAIHAAWS
ncbi:MAG: class A beta-lactamase-related serine hydrolase [Chloroflexota bacterium]|nr:class A beta-lactamase-related serine hydrolase [Chloroflexota bacterium]